eukprot:10182576-Heterocapsa_arctica.AAC.1
MADSSHMGSTLIYKGEQSTPTILAHIGRCEWVPSHMDEADILEGTITREDKAGNEEADKLAMRGMELHKVPEHLEEGVAKQDALVKGLLQMMLKVMENVHDKAP